ncbi:quinolinate synthase NadA [Riemerella anatipestifer]|uniref:quinolinate synthase NadA n=1 Tax=Riemerella anatipestifer TaxID=34085 RepID=UPI0012AE971F|nr:quinolinate synthase NadA [Riemerella anatipestifer]USL96029.1 quinolinate synthase NadA [Riemerella anatipestifer]
MEENKKNTKTNLPVPDFLKYQEFQMPADDRLEEEILKLKQEKQIPILAHSLYGAVFLEKVSDASGNLLEIAKKIEERKWTKVLFSGTMFQAGVLKGLFPNTTFWIPKEVSKGTLEEDFYDTLREVYLSLKYEYPIVELEDDSLLVNYQK